MQEICLLQTKQKQRVPTYSCIHTNMHRCRIIWESAHKERAFCLDIFYVLLGQSYKTVLMVPTSWKHIKEVQCTSYSPKNTQDIERYIQNMKTQWEHNVIMWKSLKTIVTLASREMCHSCLSMSSGDILVSIWRSTDSSLCNILCRIYCWHVQEKFCVSISLHLSDKYLNFIPVCLP